MKTNTISRTLYLTDSNKYSFTKGPITAMVITFDVKREDLINADEIIEACLPVIENLVHLDIELTYQKFNVETDTNRVLETAYKRPGTEWARKNTETRTIQEQINDNHRTKNSQE